MGVAAEIFYCANVGADGGLSAVRRSELLLLVIALLAITTAA